MVMAYVESVEDLPEVVGELREVEREFVKGDQGWRIALMMDEWVGEHIKKFLAVSKIAIELVAEKDRGEVAGRIFKVAEKFSAQGLELRPAIHDFCEDYAIRKVSTELATKARDELVREIKKGVKQQAVDTQAISLDVPEEIHMSPTYLLFIGHITNGLTQIRYGKSRVTPSRELCTKLRIENVRPVTETYLRVIVEIGALYTEYLSAAENWMASRPAAREESLTGFKVRL